MAYSLIMLGPPLQTKPRHRDISQVRREEKEIIIRNSISLLTVVIYRVVI